VYTDPKTGKIVLSANAKALTASSGPNNGMAIGALTGVSAKLYHAGVLADGMRADTLHADEARRVVTADGAVEVATVGPAATTITCEHLAWMIDSDTLIGRGHVVCSRGRFAQTAPSFQADTRMRTVVMPAPGQGFSAADSVRAVFGRTRGIASSTKDDRLPGNNIPS
jgi:hypothetical protein